VPELFSPTRDFLEDGGATTCAGAGRRILAGEFWPANSGRRILAGEFWPANSGRRILAGEFWPAKFPLAGFGAGEFGHG
jgi:hypothetical protein